MKTILDLAISCCLTAMLLSPEIALAGKGLCAKEKQCEGSYSIPTQGGTVQCFTQPNDAGQFPIYSLCNDCNEDPCPEGGGCPCKLPGDEQIYFGVAEGCG